MSSKSPDLTPEKIELAQPDQTLPDQPLNQAAEAAGGEEDSHPMASLWSQLENSPSLNEMEAAELKTEDAKREMTPGEAGTGATEQGGAVGTETGSELRATEAALPEAVGSSGLSTSGEGDEPPLPPDSGQAAPGGEKDEDEESMGLMDHFRELRGRLVKAFLAVILGFVVCWFLRSYLVDFLFQPLLEALRATNQPEEVVALGVAEKFFTYMKIAFVGGIFVGSPLIFYQVWAFIAPGLYENEKVYVVPVAFFSAFFFVAGGAFCYLVMLPNALPFLLGFGEEYMRDTPRMTEYYEFVLQLIFAFGLIFEMPLFVFFLSRLGIVTAPMLSRFRRYFVVIAFILGAVLTPPDVMSQLFMAGPMLLLYEFSIIIARVFGRKKKEKKTETETPEAEAKSEA